METLPTFPATVNELTARFLRACSLKQAVDWPAIVGCMQEWSSAMNLTAPAILRIETAERYLRAHEVNRAAQEWAERRNAFLVLPDSWAKVAIGELERAKNAKLTIETSLAVRFAKDAAVKAFRLWDAGLAELTSPLPTYAMQILKWLSPLAI